MPLLEEVDEGMEESQGAAEDLKAEHRRKRASKARKKKRAEGASVSGAAIFRVLLGAAVFVGFGSWARFKVTDKKSNSCKMTFSRPEYVPLPVAGYPSGGEASDEFPGYGYRLMRYMDRKLPANERVEPRKPGGTPVLFVPGHAGSYEQARSLGSQVAEMKVSSPRRRLDIFALDLLEEWSALHGSLVWRQADFLNHAVEAILALYADTGNGQTHSVESVMVVGHSLGGVVTRAAFTLPSYRVGSITDIITLGSPHERAPWGMDFSYIGLYHCMDSLWRWKSSLSVAGASHCWPTGKASAEKEDTPSTSHREECLAVEGDTDAAEGGCSVPSSGALTDDSATAAVDLDTANFGPGDGAAAGGVRGWGRSTDFNAEALIGDTVLLGVSGGPKDLMVHPSLCVTDGLGLEGQSASFTTEAMEGCGFGVDHLALAWCKQLIGRVVATLSELERLHSLGTGAKERTRVASGVLAYSRRPSEDTLLANNTPKSAGFEEASKQGDELLMVARALASDRALLVIPAWAYLACLVVAAALTRGLLSKTAKEGALPPLTLLLTPESHLHLAAAKRSLGSLWTSILAKGTAWTAAFLTSCVVIAVLALGDDIASYFPGPIENALELLYSLPGGPIGVFAFRLLSGTASNLVRFVNPFDGAGNALRLHPFKGVVAVYMVTAGWMMVFVYLVALLGTIGNGIRRLLPSAAPLRRLLKSRGVAGAIVCAASVAAHVERFSLPPTFREVTLKGELSMVVMMLSLCLSALLGSLALFPSHSPVAATHQHLVLLLYAPMYALLNGPQIAATGILLRRGGSSHEPFVGSLELALTSLALLPIIASVWLARRARPFPSPPGLHAFWAEFQAQWAEEVARANGGSIGGGYGTASSTSRSGESGAAGLAAAALERPNGHGACGKCLHADGASGAIFVETDKERVSIGAGVTLGPGFRVVACDCPQREPAAPSSWCEFCRCVCKVCGGCKEAARAIRGARAAARGGRGGSSRGRESLSDELGAAAAIGLASVLVLYTGLWAFGMHMMAAPCHALVALATVGAVLCGMHWGVAKDASSSRS